MPEPPTPFWSSAWSYCSGSSWGSGSPPGMTGATWIACHLRSSPLWSTPCCNAARHDQLAPVSGAGGNDTRRLADGGRRRPLWQAARRDPAHLPELVLVRVLPLLSPGVSSWVSGLEGVEATSPEQLARERVHSSTVRARWVGSITGSSFYVGMPSALAVIYCE